MMCTLELMQNEMKGATANLCGIGVGNGQQAEPGPTIGWPQSMAANSFG